MADQSRTTAFAVPIEDLPCAPDDGDDVPSPDRPRSAAQLKTTHLQLLQGEAKKFGVTRTKSICGAYQVEDSMVVTDQRVLFLWRRWLCGMSLMSMEESFYLDDLQMGVDVRGPNFHHHRCTAAEHLEQHCRHHEDRRPGHICHVCGHWCDHPRARCGLSAGLCAQAPWQGCLHEPQLLPERYRHCGLGGWVLLASQAQQHQAPHQAEKGEGPDQLQPAECHHS